MKIVRYQSGDHAEWGVLDGDVVLAALGTPFVSFEAITVAVEGLGELTNRVVAE